LSTDNYICANCNLEVPKKNLARNADGTKNIELWSGGVNGQYARHLWQAGCMAARKRHGMLEEPNVVY
jgi:hypothetical protein